MDYFDVLLASKIKGGGGGGGDTQIKTINNISLKGTGNLTSEDLGLQDKLESGENIKTIDNESILGKGNITTKGKDVFIATYGTTTYNEVKNAIDNDKIVLLNMTGNNNLFVACFATYQNVAPTDIKLYSIYNYNGYSLSLFKVDENNHWTVTHTDVMELVSNPTVNNVLITDANGQAVDGNVPVDKIVQATPEQTDKSVELKDNRGNSLKVALDDNGDVKVSGASPMLFGTTKILETEESLKRAVPSGITPKYDIASTGLISDTNYLEFETIKYAIIGDDLSKVYTPTTDVSPFVFKADGEETTITVTVTYDGEYWTATNSVSPTPVPTVTVHFYQDSPVESRVQSWLNLDEYIKHSEIDKAFNQFSQSPQSGRAINEWARDTFVDKSSAQINTYTDTNTGIIWRYRIIYGLREIWFRLPSGYRITIEETSGNLFRSALTEIDIPEQVRGGSNWNARVVHAEVNCAHNNYPTWGVIAGYDINKVKFYALSGSSRSASPNYTLDGYILASMQRST